MKRFLGLAAFISLAQFGQAQLVNDGGTIVVQSGATLVVESDVTNNTTTSTGTITVNGTLEVKGNFTNNATLNTSTGSTVKFSGTANSNFKSNGAIIENLVIAKDNATTGTVTLLDDASVKTNLAFAPASTTGNKVVIGASNLKLTQQSTTVTGANDKNYVVASGAGMVQKTTNANSTFNFPVGDAANYTPLMSNYTGSAYATANVGVNVVNSVHPNKPVQATDFISRYWNVDATGITGYNNLLTGTYINSSEDVNGMVSKISGANFDPNALPSPGEWTYTNSSGSTASITAATSDMVSDFTGGNTLNTLNLTAYLYGAINTSGVMLSDLQDLSLLPNMSPYTPSATYSGINDPSGLLGPVVDWIKVDVRSSSDLATVLESQSLIVKPNGTIVDVNNRAPVFKGQTGNIQIGVTHRNHLAILSNPVSNFNGNVVNYNFSTSLSQAYNMGSPTQMLSRGGKFCLIAGDPVFDYFIDGLDFTSVRNGFNLGLSEVYHVTDLNLDGYVDGIDFTLQKQAFDAGYYSEIGNY